MQQAYEAKSATRHRLKLQEADCSSECSALAALPIMQLSKCMLLHNVGI